MAFVSVCSAWCKEHLSKISCFPFITQSHCSLQVLGPKSSIYVAAKPKVTMNTSLFWVTKYFSW